MATLSLYQVDPNDSACVGAQRRSCRRVAGKLQWPLVQELTSEAAPAMPLLMRPAVKAALHSAELQQYRTLLISSPEALLCDLKELECLLLLLTHYGVHVFASAQGHWVEPGGRHFPPLPKFPWAEDADDFSIYLL